MMRDCSLSLLCGMITTSNSKFYDIAYHPSFGHTEDDTDQPKSGNNCNDR